MASFAAFVAFGGAESLLAGHDEGEPFSWTNGVSIWPSELLRLAVVVLCVILLAKGARDLTKNSEDIGKTFRFEDLSARRRFSLGTFWTNLQRVYHPIATKTPSTTSVSPTLRERFFCSAETTTLASAGPVDVAGVT